MMHLQLHSSHVIKKRSNFEWGDDDYIDLQHKKALVRVARRLVHDTSHVTNLANILLEAQTNLSLISSRSGISFSLLYTSTVTDEIALLHFDNLATYFLFSQITDFEFIAQSTGFHFLNIYRFGVRRISFHFVSFRFSRSLQLCLCSWPWIWHSGGSTRQFGRGSIPGLGVIWGSTLFLVLALAPRGFSPGTAVFPSP